MLIKDGSLWSEIDLKHYINILTLKNLKSFVKNYGCESSKTLALTGSYSQDYKIKLAKNGSDESQNEKLFYLDSVFMNDILAYKCPNLRIISLEYLDLSDLKFEMFLQFINLESLSIKWCSLNENWFELTNCDSVSNIKSFYLIKTGILLKNDIESICKLMPKLTTLSLNQAQSSIQNDSIDIITNNLEHLEHLDLINTLIGDAAIASICSSSRLRKRLIHLNISMSSNITNDSLLAICENLSNLKSLYLTSCFGISNLNYFLNLNNLKYLNINNTSLDKTKIRELLLPMLPKCEIEYGFEKILNRKLMWTINGSRNCVCSF